MAATTLVVLALASACVTQRARTEVVIDVGADDDIAPLIASVILRVRGGPDFDHLASRPPIDALTEVPNPARITVVPEGDDASRVWDVLVLATTDDGRIVGRQQARGGFSSGHTLYVNLTFEACCEGVASDCGMDETCVRCSCVPVVEIDPHADAGTPELDAGTDAFALDAPGLDVGPVPDTGTDAGHAACATPLDCAAQPCSVARCERGECTYTALCAMGEVCCQGECGANCDCAGMPAGATCRRATDDCDAREVCDGTSGVCPPDVVLPVGSAVCRPASGDCDVAESCDGVSASCPPDGFQMAGRVCAAGTCNGLGACDSSCTEGAACAPANPCAVGTMACSPTPHCVETAARPPGTICRPSAGACDVAEICDGTTCPMADARRDTSFVCRAAVGSCDVEDHCDGASVDCTPDARRGAGTVCRSATAPCDLDEVCDGTSAACPADLLAPSTTMCSESSNPCLDPAFCTGSSAACPPNPFADGRDCGLCGGVCSGGICRLSCHAPYFCCEGTGTCVRNFDDCPF
ncbi:MAG: hypothetical protein K1X94_06630 [Sandaracinaceae bacterium]|nr:hypothetical protein [Sandaracinaceae bacterium]